MEDGIAFILDHSPVTVEVVLGYRDGEPFFFIAKGRRGRYVVILAKKDECYAAKTKSEGLCRMLCGEIAAYELFLDSTEAFHVLMDENKQHRKDIVTWMRPDQIPVRYFMGTSLKEPDEKIRNFINRERENPQF